MKEIRFVDTTLRDGQASLWAEHMTTSMMLPIAEELERAGFTAIELTATSHFKKCVRELDEDPWERIRVISSKIKNIPLALMMNISVTTFDITPLSVVKLWMERIAANGIKRAHIMAPSNFFDFRVPDVVKSAKAAGLEVSLATVFSVSPKHTDEYFVKKFKYDNSCPLFI